MKSKLMKNALILIMHCLCLLPALSDAQIFNADFGESDVSGSFRVITPVSSQEIISTGGAAQVSLNSTTFEISYDRLTLNFPKAELDFSDDYTVGFGETMEISTSITINSFSIAAAGSHSSILTPLSDGKFQIPNLGGSNDWVALSNQVSGSFIINAGTQTFEDTFEFDAIAIFDPRYSNSMGGGILDTTDYPNGIQFEGNLFLTSYEPASTVTIFSENINGIDYSLRIRPSNVGHQWQTEGIIFTVIPEVGFSGLILSFAMLSLIIIRKKL